MAAHGVVELRKVSAQKDPALNRVAITSASNLDNGSVFRLDTQSPTSGYTECWTATVPSISGSTAASLWMAVTPPVPFATDALGNVYRDGNNITGDPRAFYNVAGSPIDAVQLNKMDVVVMSAAAISGSPSTGDYVVPAEGSNTLIWAASAVANAFCLKLVAETYISIGSGNIDNQRVLAYKLQCVAN